MVPLRDTRTAILELTATTLRIKVLADAECVEVTAGETVGVSPVEAVMV